MTRRLKIAFFGASAAALVYGWYYSGWSISSWLVGAALAAIIFCSLQSPAVWLRLSRFAKIMAALFSLALAAALTLQSRITYSGNPTDSYLINQFLGFGLRKVLLCAGLFILIGNASLCVLGYAARLTLRGPARHVWKSRTFFTVCMLALTGTWSLYWLTYYPGNVMVDSYWILTDPISLSMNHPYFYNLLLSSVVSLGERVFGSVNGGIALMSFLQILLAGWCVSLCLAWMRRKGCRRGYLTAVVLLFAVCPFFAHTAGYIVKDVLFSVVLLLYIPLLYDLQESRGALLKDWKFVLRFIAVSIVICLARYNGYFIAGAVVLGIGCLYLQKRRIVPLLCIVCLGIGLPCAANRIAMHTVVKSEYLFQESMAIPLQQIARTVVDDDGVISGDAQAFVYQLYSREFYEQHYAPMSSDTIKWSSDAGSAEGKLLMQHNKRQFLRTWLELLPANLGIYTEAYAMQTYGFWSLSTLLYTKPEASAAQMTELGMQRTQLWPDGMQRVLEWFYTRCYGVLSEGLMWWCVALLSLFVLVSRRRRALAFVPAYALWISLMLAAPVAFLLRYVYFFAYALPFLAFIAFDGQTGEQKTS